MLQLIRLSWVEMLEASKRQQQTKYVVKGTRYHAPNT